MNYTARVGTFVRVFEEHALLTQYLLHKKETEAAVVNGVANPSPAPAFNASEINVHANFFLLRASTTSIYT